MRIPKRLEQNSLNPLMHKVAKMVTYNNGVRRHTGLTHGFQFWRQGDLALRPSHIILRYNFGNFVHKGLTTASISTKFCSTIKIDNYTLCVGPNLRVGGPVCYLQLPCCKLLVYISPKNNLTRLGVFTNVINNTETVTITATPYSLVEIAIILQSGCLSEL